MADDEHDTPEPDPTPAPEPEPKRWVVPETFCDRREQIETEWLENRTVFLTGLLALVPEEHYPDAVRQVLLLERTLTRYTDNVHQHALCVHQVAYTHGRLDVLQEMLGGDTDAAPHRPHHLH